MPEPVKTIDLGDDDGFVIVKVSGGEVRLDLHKLNNRIFEFHERNRTASDSDYCDGLVRLFAEMGLPELSHRKAQKLVEQVHTLMDELKKTPD